MRCFLCVEPDEPGRVRLAEVVAAAKAGLGEAADTFRWVQPNNIHITLHFLGNLELPVIGQLTELLQKGLRERPFRIQTGRLGRFPSGGPPKVLWLGIYSGAEELGRIYADLAASIERVGLPIEDRGFTAHLTLARARDGDRSRTRRTKWPPAISLTPIEWPVTEVTLMQSDLSGPAPLYRRIAAIRLGT